VHCSVGARLEAATDGSGQHGVPLVGAEAEQATPESARSRFRKLHLAATILEESTGDLYVIR
jgi:hypothetical protein